MRINYNKNRKNTFNKSNVNKMYKQKIKIEKEIKKIEKKIEMKVIKLDNKIKKQIAKDQVVFNRKETKEIVELETQQELLEYYVKSLEETIDDIEKKEMELDEILL